MASTHSGAAIELDWHEVAQLFGLLGEVVLSAWLKRCEVLKEYRLWRGKPVERRSFRQALLGAFNFYNLENERFYRQRRVQPLLKRPVMCPICGRPFSKGMDPYAGMRRHVYRWHRDVCMGYDCVKAYLDLILYKRAVDNVLFKPRRSIPPGYTCSVEELMDPGELHRRIKTFEDFEAAFADLMVDLAPIICEVKAGSGELPKRLSRDQDEVKVLAVKYGWGWLTLSVCIGRRVTAEALELHMPDSGKIKRGVHEFFQAKQLIKEQK